MADSHPFANTGLSQFGGDRRYGMGSADTGLGNFAAAYLAHKTGLIDLSDKTNKDSVEKNGVIGHLLKGVMDKNTNQKGPGYGNNFNPAGNTGISNDGNADIGGGFNPGGTIQNAAVPTGQNINPISPDKTTLLPSSATPLVAQPAPLNLSSGNTGMDAQLSSSPQLAPIAPNQSDAETNRLAQKNDMFQTNSSPPVAYHDFDSDISNYAGMIGADDLGSLASFFI